MVAGSREAKDSGGISMKRRSVIALVFVIGAAVHCGLAIAQPVKPAPVVTSPTCANSQITAALVRAGKGSGADTGTNGLCNPDRYRGQSSMPDLVMQSFFCNDPWIGEAYQDLGYGRPQGSGGSGDCETGRYGGGRWSNYDDLKNKIRAYKTAAAAPPAPRPVPAPAAPVAVAPAAPPNPGNLFKAGDPVRAKDKYGVWYQAVIAGAEGNRYSIRQAGASEPSAERYEEARLCSPADYAKYDSKCAEKRSEPAPAAIAARVPAVPRAPTPPDPNNLFKAGDQVRAKDKYGTWYPAVVAGAEGNSYRIRQSGASAPGAELYEEARLCSPADFARFDKACAEKRTAAAPAPAPVAAPKVEPEQAAAKPTIQLAGLAGDGSIDPGGVLRITVNNSPSSAATVITPPTERIFVVEGSAGDKALRPDIGFEKKESGPRPKFAVLSSRYTVELAPGTYRIAYVISGPYQAPRSEYSAPFRVVTGSMLPTLATAETQRALAAVDSMVGFMRTFQRDVLGDPAVKRVLDNETLAEAGAFAEAAYSSLTDPDNPYSVSAALANPSKLAELGIEPGDADRIVANFHAGLAGSVERQHAQLLAIVRNLRPEAVVDATPYLERSVAVWNLDETGLPAGLGRSLQAREVKVKWDTFTSAEKIVLTIQMSRVLYFSQEFVNEFDKRLDDLLESISKALDKIENIGDILRKGPGIPGAGDPRVLKAIRFVKVLDVATVSAKVARVVLQVSVALWPSRISDFYVDINNQGRDAGTASVTIPLGQETRFSVYLIPQSPGWSKKITREELINEATALLLKHFPAAGRAPDEKAAERRIENYKKAMAELKKRFPKIAQWLDVGYVVTPIKEHKYPAFELNDVRFVQVQARSTNLIEITPRDRRLGDNVAYRIKGLAAGTDAGYGFELRNSSIIDGLPTLREIVQASKVAVDRRGVVNISGKPPPSPDGRRCGDGTNVGVCSDGRCLGGGAVLTVYNNQCR